MVRPETAKWGQTLADLRRLSVETDNARALALYHKMGFTIEGQIKHALQIKGQWYDDYVMAKSVIER